MAFILHAHLNETSASYNIFTTFNNVKKTVCEINSADCFEMCKHKDFITAHA